MFGKNLNSLWLVSLLLAGSAAASDGNRTHFLSHGPGAAAQSVGESFTALADDATALYYNPAGLVFQRGSFYGEHIPIETGGRTNFIGAHLPSKAGSFGFGLYQFYAGDIETRTSIGDNPGNASASQTAYVLPYANRWKNLGWGLSLKRLQYDLAGAKDGSWGLDAGLLASKSLNDAGPFKEPEVSLGLSLKNLMKPSLTLESESETLPREITLGLAATAHVAGRLNKARNEIVSDALTFSCDVHKTADPSFTDGGTDHVDVGAGVQYSLANLLTFRAGYLNGFRFGLGFGQPQGSFRLDYGIVTSDLNPQHQFAFTYFFSDPATNKSKPIKLRQYNLLQKDVGRQKEAFLKTGRRHLQDQEYDQASFNFEQAWILDPSDRQTNRLRDQSRQAQKWAQVKMNLEKARTNLQAKDLEVSFNAWSAALEVDPDNKEVSDFLSEFRSSLVHLDDRAIVDFQRLRQARMDRLLADFDSALRRQQIPQAESILSQGKILSADPVVLRKLENDLAGLKSQMISADLDRATVAESKGDFQNASWFLLHAQTLSPNNRDIQKESDALKTRVASTRHFNSFDRAYHDQLFMGAALRCLDQQWPEAQTRLSDLLSRDPLHESALQLKTYLVSKKLWEEN